MEDRNTISYTLGAPEYDTHFWNSLRGRRYNPDHVIKGNARTGADTYLLPAVSNGKYLKALEQESLFRRIGTVINAYDGSYSIMAKDCDDVASWVAEGDSIPVYDGLTDFTTNEITSHKLACIVKMDEDFIRDASFDFEDYLLERFARIFGQGEEQGFITGDGDDAPIGIIDPDEGAEVGVTTADITYDDVISLYFSLDREYRDQALWIMNDETALALRTLKDDAGNYLWNPANDTILGKSVVISNYMPSAEDGSMPIVFGDFHYYWVVCRKPISIRKLAEQFVIYDQIGYLGIELIDGRLVRREAVKALQIAE